ncbi:MAG: ATP-binding protein, partial [Candidatus Fonsibacter sp.]
ELIYGIKNLIDNAFKFCTTTVKVVIKSSDNYLQIIIEDDGPGFSSEIKNNLGDPYIKSQSSFISKNQGLGLGFFISKTFLERLKAKINFYNNKTSGAVVDIFWSYSDLKKAELI